MSSGNIGECKGIISRRRASGRSADIQVIDDFVDDVGLSGRDEGDESHSLSAPGTVDGIFAPRVCFILHLIPYL